MKNNLIIIRYGELGLKAVETRKRFESTLINNIRDALKTKNISFKTKREWGRIYVLTEQINQSVSVLQKIFGITSISPAVKTDTSMQSISKLAVDISKEKKGFNKSFALRVERTGNHDFSSQDVAVQVGDDIVKATNLSVDLTKPDFELFIEIRDNNAYLFTKKIRCTGGLPLRTQGTALVFVDRLESILASWYIMRRGCGTIFLNKNESLSVSLDDFIHSWYADKEIVIFDNKKSIYENINKIAVEKDCNAVITGHSLHDSSSDILSSLDFLNRQVSIPILSPLIVMESDEIQKKCEELGIKK